MVVEHQTGLTIEDYLEENIFSKLEISGDLLPRDTRPSDLSQPYDDLVTQGGTADVFGNLLEIQPYFYLGVGATTWSAGGMSMKAKDVALFGYNLYSTKGVILDNITRLLLLASTNTTPEKYGYGVTKQDINLDGETKYLYGHGGDALGYKTLLSYNPHRDISVAILSNSNNSNTSSSIDTFSNDDLFDLTVELIQSY